MWFLEGRTGSQHCFVRAARLPLRCRPAPRGRTSAHRLFRHFATLNPLEVREVDRRSPTMVPAAHVHDRSTLSWSGGRPGGEGEGGPATRMFTGSESRRCTGSVASADPGNPIMLCRPRKRTRTVRNAAWADGKSLCSTSRRSIGEPTVEPRLRQLLEPMPFGFQPRQKA